MKLDFEKKTYDKVSWDYLMEVLERKILVKWREWVNQVVTGGRVG
jgi:hypothetical protein